MTRDEKVKEIKDMGVLIWAKCPDDYEIGCHCEAWNKEYANETDCEDCWIEALEN